MKDTTPKEIKTVGLSVETEYITLDEAAAAKGCSKTTMLKWCETHNIRHIKRHGRWLVHKREVVAALQQGLADDAATPGKGAQGG